MDYYFPDDVAEPGLVSAYLDNRSLDAGEIVRITRIDQLDTLVSRLRVRRTLRVIGRERLGKSVILPKFIASVLNRPVIIVKPDYRSAFTGFNEYENRPNLGMTLPKMKATCLLGDDHEFFGNSLIWASAEDLISWLFCRKDFINYDVLLRDYVVLVDQAESMSQYIAALDGMVPTAGVAKFLSVANPSVSRNLKPGVKGLDKRASTYNSDDTPDLWNVTEPHQPWDISSDKRSMVIFLKSEEYRQSLLEKYRVHGIETHVLDWHSDFNDYITVQEALYNKWNDLVVLADASYRHSFKFFPGRIVDAADLDWIPAEIDAEQGVLSDPDLSVSCMDMYRTALLPADCISKIVDKRLESISLPDSGAYLEEVLETCCEGDCVTPFSISERLHLLYPVTDVEFCDCQIRSDHVGLKKLPPDILDRLLSNSGFDRFEVPKDYNKRWTLSVIHDGSLRFNTLATEILAIRGVIFEFISKLNCSKYKRVTFPNILRLPILFDLLDSYAIERRRLKNIMADLSNCAFKCVYRWNFGGRVDFRRNRIRGRFCFPLSAGLDQFACSNYKDEPVLAALVKVFAFNQGFSPGAETLNGVFPRDRFIIFWRWYRQAV